MKNIAYVGHARGAARHRHGGRRRRCSRRSSRASRRSMESNQKAIQLGYDYAKEHFACPLPGPPREDGRDERRRSSSTATRRPRSAASTPARPSPRGTRSRRRRACSTRSRSFCERYRTDKATGKRRYCILQAEDELAAIGMVIGAAWNGARAFTSTAGPGISLMNELIGLAYYAEIPLGHRRRAARRSVDRDADAHAAGRHPALRVRVARRHEAHPASSPRTRRECFELAVKAFDLAERFQTPVFMLTRPRHRDERLGRAALQVGRRLPPRPRARPVARGASRRSRSTTATRRRTSSGSRRARCRACSEKGAFFTRGSGHNKLGGYTEIPDEYQEVMDRLLAQARGGAGPRAAGRSSSGATGATLRRRHRRRLRPRRARGASRRSSARGIRGDFLRVRGFPFGDEVESVPRERTRRSSSSSRTATRSCGRSSSSRRRCPRSKLRSVRAYGGFPLQAAQVVDGVTQLEGGPAVSYIKKPVARHPSLQPNKLGLTVRDYEGCDVDALRRLRPRLDHRRDRARVLRARHAAAHGGEALGHRLLVEDADVLRLRRARLQLGARAHAGDRDRRRRGQPRPHVHRRERRRRLAVDRPRADVPRDPPQREHALRDREQRRATGSPRASSRRRPTSARSRSAARRTRSRRSIR